MKNFLLRYKKANNCAEKVKAKTSEYYYLDWRVVANGKERIDNLFDEKGKRQPFYDLLFIYFILSYSTPLLTRESCQRHIIRAVPLFY